MLDSTELSTAWESLARNNLSFFGEYVFRTDIGGSVIPQGFHEEWDKALSDDGIKNLMVVTPPGHAKSFKISVIFSAWFIGNNPDKHILLISNTATQAELFSTAVRDTIEFNPRYHEVFPDILPDKKKGWAGSEWFLQREQSGDKDASFAATGIGGPIIGRRADVIICDDIHDEENVATQNQRDKVYRWLNRSAFSRLQPNGRKVIVCTRWHEDDVYGRLIDSGEWEVKHYPAIDETGNALWPERWPVEKLLTIKRNLGTYLFEGMYQGNPTPPEGGLFKRSWWVYYDTAPELEIFDEILQSWDMAFTDAKTSSYVVGQVWGRIGANYYLLDQIREHLAFPTTLKAVKNLSAKWPEATRILIEDKANGPAIIDTLKSSISGIIPIQPRGSKSARAAAISPAVESGNVYLPRKAAWLGDFMEELSAFPNGTHDDQVDAMSQALSHFRGKAKRVSAAPGGTTKSSVVAHI